MRKKSGSNSCVPFPLYYVPLYENTAFGLLSMAGTSFIFSNGNHGHYELKYKHLIKSAQNYQVTENSGAFKKKNCHRQGHIKCFH